MIVAAAVCPHPPLLFRELSGQEDAVPDLRAACADAVGALVDSGPEVVVVVGGADTSGAWDGANRFDVTRFGTTQPRPASRSDLPLSLGVAGRLLEEAGWTGPRELVAVAWDAPSLELADVASRHVTRDERVGLLVMGEGSARRGGTAPGHIDDRAPAFDKELGRALHEGDVTRLRDLGTALAGQLMVLGRSSFQVLGHAVAEGAKTRMLYEDDPFGVMYFVAGWQTTDPGRPHGAGS